MNIYLWRTQYLAACVKGNLYIGGDLFCFTLEPPLKFNGAFNVPDKTCTPEGTYTVVRKASLRFERVVPVLVNVPGRSNIEMHPLNLPAQTEGCIGVGKQWINAPEIGQSDAAFGELMTLLNPIWADSQVVTLQIESIFEVAHV